MRRRFSFALLLIVLGIGATDVFAAPGDITQLAQAQPAPAQSAPPADVMADLVFSLILRREAELVDEAEAGFVVQDQLDVVRALLRLLIILSPNVRMPLSRLQ